MDRALAVGTLVEDRVVANKVIINMASIIMDKLVDSKAIMGTSFELAIWQLHYYYNNYLESIQNIIKFLLRM